MTQNLKSTKKACYLGYVIQAVVNNLASLFFVIFSAEPFNLSEEELGRLIFINFISQLIIDFLSIYIVPKFGYRKCVVVAQASSALGFIMLGILPNIMPPFIGLVVAILFLAIGSGFIEVLVSPIIEALPEDDKAGNMSFLHSFYCWGQAATVLITTFLLHIIGKQNWFYLPFLWSVLPIINTFLFARVPILELQGDKEHKFSLSSLKKQKSFYLFLFLMFSAGASELAIVQWSSYFIDIGLNVEKWLGDIIGPCLFAILMGIGRVCFAIFGKKFKTTAVIAAMALLCSICYLLVAFSGNAILTVVACAFCGLSVSVMWPGVFSLAAERFPESGSSLFSILAMFGDLGCAIGPWILGIIADVTQKNGMADVFADVVGASSGSTGIQLGFLITAIVPFLMFLFLSLVLLHNKNRFRRVGVNK